MSNSRQILETVIEFTPDSDTRSRIKRAINISDSSRLDYVISLLGNGSHLCSYDTVPIALWLIDRNNRDFSETLWNSIAVLGDRDTIGAMVGSLMALIVGKQGLPKTWIERRESLKLQL